MPLRVSGMAHESILGGLHERVIHNRTVIYLAQLREKYYNYIVLSRAECFCLCMFVQDHNAMRLDSFFE